MNELTVYENKELEFYGVPMSPDGMKEQVNHLQSVMGKVMRDGEHYGKIPGCGDKPTLLKPGAEKICMTFRLSPSYEILRENMPDGHREYEITCTLTHIPTNQVFGQGVGSCTTMEGKYRFRRVERKCPECGIEAIIKGAVTRFRPILITALSTSFGMLPMAVASSEGSEMRSPMAISIIGGLMASTFLTLFIVPILYSYFSKIKIKKDNILLK